MPQKVLKYCPEYGGKVQYVWLKFKIPHIRTAVITVIEKNANNCLEETY